MRRLFLNAANPAWDSVEGRSARDVIDEKDALSSSEIFGNGIILSYVPSLRGSRQRLKFETVLDLLCP